MKMKRIYILFAIAMIVASCKSSDNQQVVTDVLETVVEHPYGFDPDSLTCVEGKVKNGQFFSNLLTSLGMSAQDGYNLTLACDDVFDVKNLRVGNSYKAYYADDNSLRYIVYEASRTSDIVFSCQPPYQACRCDKPITVESRYADVDRKSVV